MPNLEKDPRLPKEHGSVHQVGGLDPTLPKFEYAIDDTARNTTSTSYQDQVALTFTPEASSDWLIIAQATYRGGTNSHWPLIQLDQDAGTTISEQAFGRWVPNAAERLGFFVMKKVTLSAASHTFKIQYKTHNASYTCYIYEARIMAIRLT